MTHRAQSPSTDRPARAWRCVHEDPVRPWPRGWPVTEAAGERRRYAWSVPGLAIGAPGVISGRSIAEVARGLIEIGRAGGVIGPSRRALALVLHELEPGLVADIVAGAKPAQGVARRIAVSVTLVPSPSVAAVPGEPAAGPAP